MLLDTEKVYFENFNLIFETKNKEKLFFEEYKNKQGFPIFVLQIKFKVIILIKQMMKCYNKLKNKEYME